MECSDNDWEKIGFKNSLAISFVFFRILVLMLSTPAEYDSFRFDISLTMPPGSIVIGFILGQEQTPMARWKDPPR